MIFDFLIKKRAVGLNTVNPKLDIMNSPEQ